MRSQVHIQDEVSNKSRYIFFIVPYYRQLSADNEIKKDKINSSFVCPERPIAWACDFYSVVREKLAILQTIHAF